MADAVGDSHGGFSITGLSRAHASASAGVTAHAIDLGDVYLSDKAVLRQIGLVNSTSHDMTMRLTWQPEEPAAAAAAVHFQLENQNLQALAESEESGSSEHWGAAPTAPLPANPSPNPGAGPNFNLTFNELFNHVCTVDACVVPARSTLPLVVVFVPTKAVPVAGAGDGGGAVPAQTTFAAVRGAIVFAIQPGAEAEADSVIASGVEEELRMELRARVCRSILMADVSELQFLDCVPGQSYVKEFSVWNKSQIPLVFRLVPSVWLSAESGVLECSDYDTNAPLPMNTGRRISAYAHLRIRVTFRPSKVGERDYRIYMENLNDLATSNLLTVDILTSVVSDTHQEGLLIETAGGERLGGGSVVNFGDCYSGVLMSRKLRVKNTTQVPMDVRLSSDCPGEVKFELEMDIFHTNRQGQMHKGSRTSHAGRPWDQRGSVSGLGKVVSPVLHGPESQSEDNTDAGVFQYDSGSSGNAGRQAGKKRLSWRQSDADDDDDDGEGVVFTEDNEEYENGSGTGLSAPEQDATGPRSWPFNERADDDEDDDDDGDEALTANRQRRRFHQQLLQGRQERQTTSQQGAQQGDGGSGVGPPTAGLSGSQSTSPPLQMPTASHHACAGQNCKQCALEGRRGSSASTTAVALGGVSRTVSWRAPKRTKGVTAQHHHQHHHHNANPHKTSAGPGTVAEAIWWTETRAGRHEREHRANNQIEELTLMPGVEKGLWVHFCPAPPQQADDERQKEGAGAGMVQGTGPSEADAAGGDDAMQLAKRAFKLFFHCEEPQGDYRQEEQLVGELLAYGSYADTADTEDYKGNTFSSPGRKGRGSIRGVSDVRQSSKTIAGRARVCTSVLSISRTVVDFGDCQIGEYRSEHVMVTNHSELPAAAIAHVLSKAVSCTPTNLSIPPRGSADLKIEYVPRKINSHYRKTITLINCFNARGTREIEIRAANMDTHHILYHSAFYKVLVNNHMKQQQVYFDHVVANCPSLRTFAIRNISDRPLLFEVSSSSPDEIAMYQVMTVTGGGLSPATSAAIRPDQDATQHQQALEASRDQFLEDMIWGSSSASTTHPQQARMILASQQGGRSAYRYHGDSSTGQAHRLRGMDLAVASGSDRFYRQQQQQQQQAARALSKESVGEGAAKMPAVQPDGGSDGTLTAQGLATGTGGSSTSADHLPNLLTYPYPVHWTLEDLLSKFEISIGSTSSAQHDRDALTATQMVQIVRDRKHELSKAVADGRLKPLPQKQLFQVGVDNEVQVAVVLTVKPAGGNEELQRERTVERTIHMRLLNVNSSHLPHNLRRIMQGAPSGPGGAPAVASGGGGGAGGTQQKREQLRVRGLLVRAKACRSEMAIAQKNINFGRVAVGEHASRTVAISNRSPVPLLYSISKSGSISSGFLRIPQGRKGIIPPHRSAEIEFVFRPSLAGAFAEALSVTNVQDESNTQVITIKAKVYKPETFALVSPPTEVSFGPCLVGEAARTLVKVCVRNTTSRKRQFVVEGDIVHHIANRSRPPQQEDLSAALTELDEGGNVVTAAGAGTSQAPESADAAAKPQPETPSDLVTPADSPTAGGLWEEGIYLPHYRFTLDSRPGTGISTEERTALEEKLEQYSFKLRIAERKGRDQKATKLLAKIEKIRHKLDGTADDQAGDDIDDMSMSESESDSDADGRLTMSAAAQRRLSINAPDRAKQNGLTFSLDADSVATITVSVMFAPGASFQDWDGKKTFRGVVRLYESRNEDVVKELPCGAEVFSNSAAYMAALAAPSASTSASVPTSPRASTPATIPAVSDSALALDVNATAATALATAPEAGITGEAEANTRPLSAPLPRAPSFRASATPATAAAGAPAGAGLNLVLPSTRKLSMQLANIITSDLEGMLSRGSTPELSDSHADVALRRPFFVTVAQYCTLEVDPEDAGDGIREMVAQGRLVARENPREAIKLAVSEASRAALSIHSALDMDIRVKVSWGVVQGMGTEDPGRVTYPPSTPSSPIFAPSGSPASGSEQRFVAKAGIHHPLQFRPGAKDTAGTASQATSYTHVLVVALPAGGTVDMSLRLTPQAVAAVTALLPPESSGERFGAVLVQAMEFAAYSDISTAARSATGALVAPGGAQGPPMAISGMYRVAVPVVLEATPQALLQVQRRLDLGLLALDSVTEATFTISNSCDKMEAEPVKYVVMLVAKPAGNTLTVTEHQTGTLPPKGSQDVRLSLRAAVVGRWMHDIVVRNLANKHDQATVTVTATVKPAMYLHFPDLDPAALGKLQEIQIGNCYLPPVEPTRAPEDRGPLVEEALRPLSVRNVSSQHLYLTAIPNLRKQCFIYSRTRPGGELTQVVDLSLPAHADVTLYIELRPVLPLEAYVTGDIRELVGGIRFVGFSRSYAEKMREKEREKGEKGKDSGEGKDDSNAPEVAVVQVAEPDGGARADAETVVMELAADKLFELTVKFVGTAGVSIMRAAPTQSKFAVLKCSEGRGITTAYGQFQLENGSKALPLDYRLPMQRCIDGAFTEEGIDQALLSMLPGTAELLVVGTDTGTIPPNTKVALKYCILSKGKLGLIHSRIKVENCSAPGPSRPTLTHTVRALITDGSVQADFEPAADAPSGGSAAVAALCQADQSAASSGLTVGTEGGAPVPSLEIVVIANPVPVMTSSAESNAMGLVRCRVLLPLPDAPAVPMMATRTFTLSNSRSAPLLIFPYSDLPIRVELADAQHQGDDAAGAALSRTPAVPPIDVLAGHAREDAENSDQGADESGTEDAGMSPPAAGAGAAAGQVTARMLHLCGEGLLISPNTTVAVVLRFRKGAPTPLLPADQVSAGEALLFQGTLALAAVAAGTATLSVPRTLDLAPRVRRTALPLSLSPIPTPRQALAGGGSGSAAAAPISPRHAASSSPSRRRHGKSSTISSGAAEDGHAGAIAVSAPLAHRRHRRSHSSHHHGRQSLGGAAGALRVVALAAVKGAYCRSRVAVQGGAVVDMGKIGLTDSAGGARKPVVATLTLASHCQVLTPVVVLGLPPYLCVFPVPDVESELPPSQSHADAAGILWVPPKGELRIAVELTPPPPDVDSEEWRAGRHSIALTLQNLFSNDPEDLQALEVRFQVVRQLVRVSSLPSTGEAQEGERQAAAAATATAAAAAIVAAAAAATTAELKVPEAEARVALALPAISLPPDMARAERCEGVLSVQNVFDEPVSVLVAFEPAPELRGLIDIQLSLARQAPPAAAAGATPAAAAAGPSDVMLLSPEEVASLQVLCQAVSGARVPPELLPAQGSAARTVQLGSVVMQLAPSPPAATEQQGAATEGQPPTKPPEVLLRETVAVTVALRPGTTMAVSARSLVMQALGGDATSLSIRNVDAAAELRYSVRAVGRVAADPASAAKTRSALVPVVTPSSGEVPPGDSCTVTVALAATHDTSRRQHSSAARALRNTGTALSAAAVLSTAAAAGTSREDGGGILCLMVTDVGSPGYPPIRVDLRVAPPPAPQPPPPSPLATAGAEGSSAAATTVVGAPSTELTQAERGVGADASAKPLSETAADADASALAAATGQVTLAFVEVEARGYSEPLRSLAPATACAAVDLTSDGARTSFNLGDLNAALSVLELRGCTPIAADATRYEINVGQQLVNPSSMEWEVTIGNLCAQGRAEGAVEYKLFTLHETDVEWLTLGNSKGTLAAGKSQAVTLYLNRTRMGVFSTYMVMENARNPADLKFVRVEMEVVQQTHEGQQLARLFQVLVSPFTTGAAQQEQGLVMNFGDVYEGKLYNRRSFVILNSSAMPLEFQLSSSLSPSELNFSLSAVTLKQFKSVTIEANSKLQVFVHYAPVARQAARSTRQLSSAGWEEANASLPVQEVPVREHIYITCRLVKDFQQVVQLWARRRTPQLRTHVEGTGDAEGSATYGDATGILFVAKELKRDEDEPFAGMGGASAPTSSPGLPGSAYASSSSGGGSSGGGGGGSSSVSGSGVRFELQGGQTESLVTVTNNTGAAGAGEALSCAIRNVALYFTVEPQEDTTATAATAGVHDAGIWDTSVVAGAAAGGPIKGVQVFSLLPGTSLRLRVTPNMEALSSGDGLSLLANDEHVEEHFMVYNMQHPTEKYRVSLKLTSGALRTFFLAPGPKNAYQFWTLEDNITSFLRAYHCMWAQLFQARPALASILGDIRAKSNPLQEPELSRVAAVLQEVSVLAEALEAVRIVQDDGSNFNITSPPATPGGNAVAPGGGGAVLEGVGPMVPIPLTTLPASVVAEELGEAAAQCARLSFEMLYLTDELLYYALKHEGYVGDFALKLANLLYSVAFKHQVFAAFAASPSPSEDAGTGSAAASVLSERERERQSKQAKGGGGHGEERGTENRKELPALLIRFAAHLDYFLSFFPYVKAGIKPLVDLRGAVLRN